MDPKAPATPAAEPTAALLLNSDDPAPAPEAAPPAAAPAQPEGTPTGEEKTPPAEGAAPEPVAQEPKTDQKPAPSLEEIQTKLDQLQTGFAALTKREKEIREERNSLKADRAELNELRELKKTLESDPLALMRARGLTGERLIDSILELDKTPTVEDEVKSLKAQIAAREKAEADARAKAEEDRKTAVVEGEISFVREYVGQSEKYPLVDVFDASAQVRTRFYEHLQADEVDLAAESRRDPAKAKKIHDEYLDRAAGEIEKALRDAKATKLTRLQPNKPASPATPSSNETDRARATSGSVTLSNRTASEAPPSPADALPLDPDKRDEALLRRIRQQGGFFSAEAS